MKIHTKLGLIERGQLRVKDVVSEEDNARVIATEWYLGEELVRRDVFVNVLRGLAIRPEQAELRSA